MMNFKGKTQPYNRILPCKWMCWWHHPWGNCMHLGTSPWSTWNNRWDRTPKNRRYNSTPSCWKPCKGCYNRPEPAAEWGTLRSRRRRILRCCSYMSGSTEPEGWNHLPGRCRRSRGCCTGSTRIPPACSGVYRKCCCTRERRRSRRLSNYRVPRCRRCSLSGPKCVLPWCRSPLRCSMTR